MYYGEVAETFKQVSDNVMTLTDSKGTLTLTKHDDGGRTLQKNGITIDIKSDGSIKFTNEAGADVTLRSDGELVNNKTGEVYPDNPTVRSVKEQLLYSQRTNRIYIK